MLPKNIILGDGICFFLENCVCGTQNFVDALRHFCHTTHDFAHKHSILLLSTLLSHAALLYIQRNRVRNGPALVERREGVLLHGLGLVEVCATAQVSLREYAMGAICITRLHQIGSMFQYTHLFRPYIHPSFHTILFDILFDFMLRSTDLFGVGAQRRQG